MICGACGQPSLDPLVQVLLQRRLRWMDLADSLDRPGSDHWETCELAVREKGGRTSYGAEYQLWAQAFGPQGEYSAGETPRWRQGRRLGEQQSPPALAARTALIEQLVAEGWEPVSVGPSWWQTTFRRRVDPCGNGHTPSTR